MQNNNSISYHIIWDLCFKAASKEESTEASLKLIDTEKKLQEETHLEEDGRDASKWPIGTYAHVYRQSI